MAIYFLYLAKSGWHLPYPLALLLALAIAVVMGLLTERLIVRPLFDAPRVNPITGRGFVAPLFGIQNKRPDFFDLSIGGRMNLWRDTLIGFANVIVPLSNDGFRSDAIPTVGFEVIL